MIRHKRPKTGELNVVLSIKIPIGLKNRIELLSQKGCISRNKWIVDNLARNARYKGDHNV